MKYQLILDFIKIVNFQTYAEAGKKLKMSKAEIHKICTELEDDLETSLVNEDPEIISLTETGTQLRSKFNKYDTCVSREIENSIHDIDNVHGTVRVLLPQYIFYEMSSFFVNIHRLYPLVKIEVSFYDGSNLDYKLHLDYDLIIYNGVPELSIFYIHKVGSSVQQFFCTPAFIEKHGVIDTPQCLVDKKYSHKIVCTEWANKLVLPGNSEIPKVIVPLKNIAAVADNIYDILYRRKIDDYIFVAICNKRLYNIGYINLFPNYSLAERDIYLLRNKFKDSALVVNVEKQLRIYLMKSLAVLSS